MKRTYSCLQYTPTHTQTGTYSNRRTAREKETQAINLSNIQFHSNYESTVRKLKRFIRVEKVFGGNFSSNCYLCSLVYGGGEKNEMRGRCCVGCAILCTDFLSLKWLFMSRNLSSVLTFPLVCSFFLCVFHRGLLFIIFICYPVCSLVIKWKSVLPSRRFEFFSVFVFFLDVSSPHSVSFSVSF